jgi:hypothetical protein
VTRVYEEWLLEPGDPAAALARAQRWVIRAPSADIAAWVRERLGPSAAAIPAVRQRLLRRPHSWAPLVFTGA